MLKPTTEQMRVNAWSFAQHVQAKEMLMAITLDTVYSSRWNWA